MNTFVISAKDRSADIERLTRFLHECLPGKALRVEVCQNRKRRSDEQNRALWGVAYRILSEETGYDPAELHEFFLGSYFGWQDVEIFGEHRRRPARRSSKLNTMEFSDYYAFIQRRAAELLGVYVPDPGEFERES